MSLLPLARLLPLPVWEQGALAAAETFAFFNPHQADVVREATARIIPGPLDDPLEAGHAGAREANVVRFVDTLLSALDAKPEKIHGGGPYGAAMTQFVALSPQQRRGWEARLAALKTAYRNGIAQLDALAGGDFTTASAPQKDRALTSPDATPFTDILYTHAIEGTYSHPLYGGNAGRSGWREITFPGDSQPRGYDAKQVGESDGPDVVDPTGVVGQLLQAMATDPAAQAAASRYGR
ncbi:MAG: gluconate 2-dehydrogenase subunit 3 family protein [Actinobacteria bacterium]|nr:gluconate 2-dehydrogenase subunit 3 family protein [Actinomycetota bacterium]